MLSLWSALAFAAPLIPVSGMLTDTTGAPLDGSSTLTFALHPGESAAATWSETQTVSLVAGAFSAGLGGTVSVPTALLSQDDLFLSVAVGAGAPSTPVRVAWAPRAMWAANAGQLGGLAPAAFWQRTDDIAWSSLDGALHPAAATGYSAAAGGALTLSGTVFAVNEATVRGWAYDQPSELTAALAGQYMPATGTGAPSFAGVQLTADTTTDCDSGHLGAVRWTGSDFEGCTAAGWRSLVAATGTSVGATAASAAASCQAIKTATPDAPSGIYWITPPGDTTRRAWCDMETAGGGWTLCLSSRYTKQAEALFTSTYSKVVPTHPGGYYDWCDNNKTDYLVSLGDDSFGGLRLHTATFRVQNPTPYAASGEWNTRSIQFAPANMTWINTPAGVNTGCASWQLDFWEYINPASRGLKGFKRGHIKCEVSISNPGVSFVMGAGCNYGSCTSPPSFESDVYPTYSSWTWIVTATVGNGNNAWNAGPIRADRMLVFYR